MYLLLLFNISVKLIIFSSHLLLALNFDVKNLEICCLRDIRKNMFTTTYIQC